MNISRHHFLKMVLVSVRVVVNKVVKVRKHQQQAIKLDKEKKMVWCLVPCGRVRRFASEEWRLQD